MDDVLERAEIYVERFDRSGPFPSDGRDAREIIAALAAEVRRLRKDRERLDWLGDAGVSIHAGSLCYAIIDSASGHLMGDGDNFRDAIDAAMASRGGEGE